MTPQEIKLHQMHLDNLAIYGGLRDWQAGGMCVFLEAAGEPFDGRIGVGTVILDRVRLKYRGISVIDVICWPYQFSWSLSTDPQHQTSLNITKDFDEAYKGAKALQECSDLFRGLLMGTTPLDQELMANDCVEYLNPKTAPEAFQDRLKEGFTVWKQIEKHVFLWRPKL